MGKVVNRNNNRDKYWYRYQYRRAEEQAAGSGTDQPAATKLSSCLFVRNIALETSADTIRSEFEIFGLIKDVYLPKDFSTGTLKGYGFIKYQNAEDAKLAKEYLNHRVIDGQEISIEYSSDSNRKKPWQMALMNSRSRYFQFYSGCFRTCNTISDTFCETTFKGLMYLKG